MQRRFEQLLWQTRLLVLIAVIASVVMAIAAFIVATVDVWSILGEVVKYLRPGDADHFEVRAKIIALTVKALDAYILATLLFVFAYGLYELFIHDLEIAEQTAVGKRLLKFESVDDLKDKVFKLILLLLVVEFFDAALALDINDTYDGLALAAGTFLVGAAFFISNLKIGKGH